MKQPFWKVKHDFLCMKVIGMLYKDSSKSQIISVIQQSRLENFPEVRYNDGSHYTKDEHGRFTGSTSSGGGGSSSGGMYRKQGNSGEFAQLPERMSKKHIRDVADEFDIDLKGITIHIDDNPELLRLHYAGRADPEQIGGITFFPNAFKSREELVRTIYHEKQHVLQYKKYGSDYVQNNRAYFERITENLEENFVKGLKASGKL